MNAPARIATPFKSARGSMIGKIHVAKSQLKMVDDDYRELLFREAGVMSAADASDAGLAKILDEMKRLGFKPLPPKKPNVRIATHPVARKARALWISLHYLGAVVNPSEQALEAFAKRQLRCERLSWANQGHGYKLVEALKAMALREGWDLSDPGGPADAKVITYKRRLVKALLVKLVAAGGADASWMVDDLPKRFGLYLAREYYHTANAEELDQLAKAMAKKLHNLVPPGTTKPLPEPVTQSEAKSPKSMSGRKGRVIIDEAAFHQKFNRK